MPVLVRLLSTEGHWGWSEANKGVRALSKKLHGLHGNIGMPPWLEANLEFESIHNRQLLDAISLLNAIKLLKIGFMEEKGREQQRTSVIVEMAVSKAQRVLGTPRAYCYCFRILLLSWRSSWGHPRTAQAQQLSCHVMSLPQEGSALLCLWWFLSASRCSGCWILNVRWLSEGAFDSVKRCGCFAAQWVC